MRFSRAVHWHTTIWHMLHKPIFSDVSATTQTHGLPMNARPDEARAGAALS